jgi:hypothetical protein
LGNPRFPARLVFALSNCPAKTFLHPSILLKLELSSPSKVGLSKNSAPNPSAVYGSLPSSGFLAIVLQSSANLREYSLQKSLSSDAICLIILELSIVWTKWILAVDLRLRKVRAYA